MNASIQGIIDHMFRDTVDNAETRALHEELLNNCLEHYDDLIGRGMSETEAIDAVVDSLKGMKEVIDEYPRKPGREENRPENRKENIPEVRAENTVQNDPPADKPSEYTYHISAVRKLKTDLKNCDLKIGASADSMIHIRCEDMEQLTCELNSGTLTVGIVDKTRKSVEEAGKQMNSQEFSVKSLLNFIGKAIGSVATGLSVNWDVYIDIPAAALAEMDLNAKSGDIEVRAVLPERLNAHSMSGDITVSAADQSPASRVTASAMSGDVKFSGNADTVTLASMSGEVKARGKYRTAELKSTSGDAEIDGEAEQVRVNSVSGDVEVNLGNATVSSIQARSTSGDVDISLAAGTDSVHASMSTVSGTARCGFRDGGAGARIQIQASSVSGDVTIK